MHGHKIEGLTMLKQIISLYDKITKILAGNIGESLALLFVRVALAYQFWAGGRAKVEEGTLLTLNEFQRDLFINEFGMPGFMAPIAMYAEHILPILVVFGLFTRFGAAGLFVMTMVIELFVTFEYGSVWWNVHIMWAALALILVSRGAGPISLDAILVKRRK